MKPPILLVDDSLTMLMTVSAVLQRSGYAVETEVSGKSALQRVAAGLVPGLTITDYHMPGMSGIELVRHLRKQTCCWSIPILILTTDSEQQSRDQAKAAGATGWLLKPVDPNHLLQVIKQVAPNLQS